MEKIDRFEFVCEPFHSDFTGSLLLSVLGNHLLNCAGQHASKRGFGIARLNDEDHTWVLSRVAIDFVQMPHQYERFSIDTWVESVYRLFTDRNFVINNADGQPVAYARTVWAMIGMKGRKPVDLSTLCDGKGMTDFTTSEVPCPIEKPGRIKVTSTEAELSFTAHYSDIDINGHVNSMRYIEHAMDVYPLDFLRTHTLRRFEIAYIAESYCGDQIGVFVDRQDDDTVWQVELRKADDGSPLCRCKFVWNLTC